MLAMAVDCGIVDERLCQPAHTTNPPVHSVITHTIGLARALGGERDIEREYREECSQSLGRSSRTLSSGFRA
jgi:hypothetical protein